MNKASPNTIVDEFLRNTSERRREWESIDSALKTQGAGIDLRRRASANAFMALVTSWESYASRWFVAAVNKKPDTAIERLTSKIQRYATEELSVPHNHVASTVITKKHLNVADVKTILAPKDRNVVFRNVVDLRDRSNEWLEDPYASTVTGISGHDFSPALAARLIRNVFAHESDASIDDANEGVGAGSMDARFRKSPTQRLNPAGWRRYLHETTNVSPRVGLFHDALADIATLMRT